MVFQAETQTIFFLYWIGSLLVLGVLAAADLALAELGHVGVGERGLQPEGSLHQLRLGDDLAQADRRLRPRRLLLLRLLVGIVIRIVLTPCPSTI